MKLVDIANKRDSDWLHERIIAEIAITILEVIIWITGLQYPEYKGHGM